MSTPFAKKIPGRAGPAGGAIDRESSAHAPQHSVLFSNMPASLVN
jgi:hypothetical protein